LIAFPPYTYIPLISSTKVLYFKHRDHDKNAPPHNFVTIPGNNNHLIIVTITSQIDKILSWYTGRNLESLIILEPHTLNYLPLKSLINCNSPEMYTREDFVKRIIDPIGPWIIRDAIDKDLEMRINTTIKNSLLAKPKIIKALS
jgi:hypothetical protein